MMIADPSKQSMQQPQTLADRIRLETLKLLVEAAWADREIDEREADYIMLLARQCNASDEDIASIEADLADERRLPAPNMQLLRASRTEVLRAVDEIIAIDNRIVADEKAARAAIARLLD